GPMELDICHGEAARPGAPHVLDGHELVEDPVVEHQGEETRGFRLHAHETLRGRVDLDTVDAPAHPLLDHTGVRGEGDAAVDEHAEIGPALGEVANRPAFCVPLAGHTLEEDDHPRGHAGDEAEILTAHELRDAIDALFPILDRADLGPGRIPSPN